jgi:hypothetical protein
LNNASILVMCDDAQTANALVARISAARGDVVFAATAVEALQRLRQLRFHAAVASWQTGADAATVALQARCVPFCMFGTPPSGAVAPVGAPLVVTDDQVVPVLMTLLAP